MTSKWKKERRRKKRGISSNNQFVFNIPKQNIDTYKSAEYWGRDYKQCWRAPCCNCNIIVTAGASKNIVMK